MKVIDLLNKIANGEEVPKKIKYDNQVFEYKEDMFDYYCYDYALNLMGYQKVLTDEVEIIEDTPKEKKIPKKLGECAYVDGEIAYSWSKSESLLKTKINEIIDYLEENK